VVDLLDPDAGDVVMVATHEDDLDASREPGLHTAYVHRPLEWGPDARRRDGRSDGTACDVVTEGFLDCAERLDAPPIGR